MNIQRRTFLQALGALGISIAVPQAVPETLKVAQCDLPVHFIEGGTYALMAFHREWVARRSVFPRVPFTECRRVLTEYGVEDGEYIWAKLPLIARPNPFDEDLHGNDYFIPGGMAVMYSAHKIVYAHDGRPFRVVKNKIDAPFDNNSAPEKLYTTEVAMLHPFNNMFAGPDVPGEIMIM